MAQLPAGWVDTGITQTQVLEFDLQFRAQFHVPAGIPYFDFDDLVADGITVYTRPATAPLSNPNLGGAEWDSANTVEVVLNDNGTLTVLASGGGAAFGDPGYIATLIHCKRTTTNVRLGVRISPEEWLEYSWFRDSASVSTWEIGAVTVKTESGPEPPQDLGSGSRLLFFRSQLAFSSTPAFPMAKMHTFLSQGAAMSGVGPLEDPPSYSVGLTWNWTADLRTIDETGSAAYAADIVYDGANDTTPATPTRSVLQDYGSSPPLNPQQLVSPAVFRDPWLAAQTIIPDVIDRTFVFEGNQPKVPSGAFTSYVVGTLTLAANRDVLLSGAGWTTTGGGTLELGTIPFLLITSVLGNTAFWDLQESWRDWNNPVSGDYEPTDNFTATDHDFYASGAGDDVWGWSRFAYLDLTYASATATTLLITLLWAVVREDGTVISVPRTYDLPVAGAGTYRVDLLFPNEGAAPFFAERVDRLTISGFAVGTYDLTAVRLVAVEDAYVRVGGLRIGDRGGVMLAQDGQFCLAHWDGDPSSGSGDSDDDGLEDHNKDQQNGIFGVAAVETDTEVVEHLGGAAGMLVDTLTATFGEIGMLEGAASAYTPATLTSALSDGFGAAIKSAATYPAYWFLPNLPHERVAPGGVLDLRARVVVRDVVVPAGFTAANFIAYQRNRLGCALESQGITAARGRSAAGVTATARARVGAPAGGTDPSLGTGVTDASGYVTVSIRTGELKLSAGVYSPFWVYLEG